jgi:predicted DCC family thiol-disulfide oxidoreductase YuxK
MHEFKSNTYKAIILFDGVCNLCNASVNFIIKKDKNDSFRFASIQGETGKVILDQLGIDPKKEDTIILYHKGKFYTRSTAVLRIVRSLNGLWPILYVFIVVPKFIRDSIYRFIAKHRYSWFGQKDSCMVPTKELLGKFL